MAAQLYKTSTGQMFHAGHIAIVTVGLPARGKTYLAQKLSRYLRWLGVQTAIFSVGDYRRRIIGSQMPHAFFSSAETAEQRLHVANQALDDLVLYLKPAAVDSNTAGSVQQHGQVAIYDASNTDQSRRDFIYQRLHDQEGIQVLFVEAVCEQQDIIAANIRQVKLSSPDYAGMAPDLAVADFLKRIEAYRPHYSSLSLENTKAPFIQTVDVGEQIVASKIQGYLQTRIVYYLMNLHIMPRRIYLTRNGESLNETVYRSDAPLSASGEDYADQLPQFLNRLRTSTRANRPLKVWTSPRQRSFATGKNFGSSMYTVTPVTVSQRPSLVEINPGAVDGLSQSEIEERFPLDYARWQTDPYSYRYPRAESYHDLAVRIEDILLEMEHEKDDILIIAHPTVLRCIYAYLLDRPEQEIPQLAIDTNTVYELIPVAYGCKETRHSVVT